VLETDRDPRVPCALFLGVFAAYLFSAYPFVAPRDCADLALAALRLSLAHPPGYPLYALLGHAWLALLPFGNAAYRLNLLSAAGGAGACVVLFLSSKRWVRGRAALAAPLALAFGAASWKFSLLSEMYSLHALFVLLLFWLSDGEEATLERRASASGLAAGLGLANHQSLLLVLPGILWIWRGRLSAKAWAKAAACLAAGLSLYAVVWLRLGSLPLALAVILRREYGTFTMYGGLARPFSAVNSGALLYFWLRELLSSSFVVAAFAALGAAEGLRRRPALTQGLLIALASCGPAFVLMSRFDPSDWVARTVLESAFVAPGAILCVLASMSFEGLPEGYLPHGALILALAPFVMNARTASHRRDFSAYDYLHDLRRELPPGSAVLVGGDTALFGLRYLEAVRPREAPLELVSSREAPQWRWKFEERWKGRVFTTGLPLETLSAWGLNNLSRPLNAAALPGKKTLLPPGVKPGSLVPQPQGLVQEVLPESPGVGHENAAWTLSTLRWGPALAAGEPYAHDIRLSYAFAHYLTARIEELSGPGAPIEHDRWARLLDPEDYRLARAGE
jgi:hypothetical protein